ncbi:mechanosensitive ion channel family protein [Aquibacillus salsiterrae]|uniref:Mechanosensitive ion channel family protein n=1 Tax=Aquibacillus salsiterrae TaxID=2950439 RepID=A0A9X3WGE8_9BACI|nr:mechanosensitive ion channel domain-containing protein [Aquibacillus salsiterrae]MDC3418173.1 mechanosensitive ion channel family protein [Aquibacillus salsiterrae]
MNQLFNIIDDTYFLKLLFAAALALITYFLLKRVILLFFNHTHLLKDKNENTLESILISLFKYSTTIGFIAYSLTVFGVEFGNLLAGAGVIGILIGFSARSIIQDLITGLFILYEKQLKQGDYIRINSKHEGVVENISLRFLRIRKWSGSLLSISHAKVNTIENYNKEKMRVITQLTVSFYEDPEKIIYLLEQICARLNEELDYFLLKDERGISLEPFTMYGLTSINDDYRGYQYTITALVKPEQYFTAKKQAEYWIAKTLYESGVRLAEQYIDTRANQLFK